MTMNTWIRTLGSAALAVAFFAGCAADGSSTAESSSGGEDAARGTIVDIAASDARFSTLVSAVSQAGLVETLSGEGPFTVFAPTDDAFAALSALPSGDDLSAVLTYHVLSGNVMAETAVGVSEATTVNGAKIWLHYDGETLWLNGRVRVTMTDIVADNGVIHVIDGVLLPPAGDIVEIASSNPDFETLVSAVSSAGLAPTLSGEGPFTVFAPTDAAFEALATLPNGDALRDVLLYHVVSGAVGSAQVVGLDAAPTVLEGASISVDASSGGVVLNGSVRVVSTDIVASNGIVHVIDAVLIPN